MEDDGGMLRKYIIVFTNCDCSSGLVAVTQGQIDRWRHGPRCPGCLKVLGAMQWNDTNVVMAAPNAWQALQDYRAKKASNTTTLKRQNEYPRDSYR